MTTQFTQVGELVIDDLDTLKVTADPLRLQIIETLLDHPHTVKQIAHKLEIPASKLYYHINLLEKHGLIRIVSTRMVSGIVEKSYQTTARNLRVQKGLLNPPRSMDEPDDDGMGLLVGAILDDAKQDIKQNAASGLIDLTKDTSPLNLNISRTMTRLTPEQALAFQAELKALAETFQAKKDDGANADEQGYALVLVMYPTARGTKPSAGDDTN